MVSGSRITFNGQTVPPNDLVERLDLGKVYPATLLEVTKKGDLLFQIITPGSSDVCYAVIKESRIPGSKGANEIRQRLINSFLRGDNGRVTDILIVNPPSWPSGPYSAVCAIPKKTQTDDLFTPDFSHSFILSDHVFLCRCVRVYTNTSGRGNSPVFPYEKSVLVEGFFPSGGMVQGFLNMIDPERRPLYESGHGIENLGSLIKAESQISKVLFEQAEKSGFPEIKEGMYGLFRVVGDNRHTNPHKTTYFFEHVITIREVDEVEDPKDHRTLVTCIRDSSGMQAETVNKGYRACDIPIIGVHHSPNVGVVGVGYAPRPGEELKNAESQGRRLSPLITVWVKGGADDLGRIVTEATVVYSNEKVILAKK